MQIVLVILHLNTIKQNKCYQLETTKWDTETVERINMMH